MINKSLLAVSVASVLAVASTPSFAGYICGTNSLTGYTKVTNFVPVGVNQQGPVFDGVFNATLRDLNGNVHCEVPASGYHTMSASGTMLLDPYPGVFNPVLGNPWDFAVQVNNPLSLFSGVLNITGLTPGVYDFNFAPGVIGAPDNHVLPFGFSIDYDGNTSGAALTLINSLLGTSFVNTNGAGTLSVNGLIGTDGATMTITESNLNWVGFEKLLFGADQVFGPSSPNIMDGNFALRNVQVHVPEPASIALLGLGLAGLGMMRRRKA